MKRFKQLSQKNEKRYLKMNQDFKKNVNVYRASNVEDLIKRLHKDGLPFLF